MSSVCRLRLTPMAGAICLLAQMGAQAQSAPPPAAAASSASSSQEGVHSLSTVVISGPRATGFTSNVVGIGAFRDQAPVDVPLTNSVITREVLESQGAASVMDAVRNTAGVTRTQLGAATYDNIAIRGVNTENRSSFRLNGSLPILGLIAIPMEDKERVEVLKGASSMYYGMVPPAGILSFEMKRAGPKPVTSVTTTANEYGGYTAALDVGRRFGENDKFGLRVNLADGKEDIGVDHYSGRRNLLGAAFDFRVLDNLTVRADFEKYQKKASDPAMYQISFSAPVLPIAPKNTVNLAPENAITNSRATNALLRADWGFSENWNLTTEYGIAKASRDRLLPTFLYDGATTTPAFQTPASYSQTTGPNGSLSGTRNPGGNLANYHARMDLSGRIETGPVAHEVTVGITRSVRVQDSFNSACVGSAVDCPKAIGLEGTNSPYSPTEPISKPLYTNGNRGSNVARIREVGTYALDRIIISKQLHVMLGIRHTDLYTANTVPVLTNQFRTKENSPQVSVIFKPTQNNSIYVSRLTGISNGSTVPDSFVNFGALLPPVKATQTELGYKHQLGGLLMQGAFFNIEQAQPSNALSNICDVSAAALQARFGQNAQGVQVGDQFCGLTQANNGKARFRGLELQASGDINRNFGVVASAMLMNATVLQDSTPNDPNLIKGGFINIKGKTPGNTPKQTFSLFGEYRPDALPGLGVNAGLYFTGRRPVNNVNSAYIGGQTLFSLGARYRMQIQSTAATFQLNVENAANKSYWASGDSTSNPQLTIAQGLPRMIKASAKFDF